MITYTCDSCMAPIEGSVRISARGDRNHFCSPVCLSVWWTKQGNREAHKPIEPRRPQPPVRATLPPPQPRTRRARPLTPEQDTEILRRYNDGEPVPVLAAEFDVAHPTIYKAITRARAAVPQARDAARDADRDAIAEVVGLTRQVVDRVVDAAEAAAPVEAPAPAPVAKPQTQQRKSTTPVTARCRDCPRTWNLTGRVLKMTIDLHEHQRGHVVDIEEGALDA
ncbi:helix-turn-helix DNA binding domain protein [Mycobacterium phage Venti]|uniref:Helix-turn-helix DNA binding domain protein n=1 Tax=Mycobacterium phage Bartholomew TaxID=2015875 RepID=A0A222ZR11_9CAUD|nr:HTH DNA binding protein [Mycobacterium phage Bartholomew]ASR86430.1 helix-turn-helix DNA binding domain protein [Mycobacterium phage Bartholomew]UVK59453.1 helix-turn-helix DNA binding domain protein [Mycobacterium phage Venti]